MNLTFTYQGRAHSHAAFQIGPHPLVVAVECRVGGLPAIHGLLDTAAQWCILPPSVARTLGLDLEPDSTIPAYSTRHGTMQGRLERLTVTFVAEDGAEADVDAT